MTPRAAGCGPTIGFHLGLALSALQAGGCPHVRLNHDRPPQQKSPHGEVLPLCEARPVAVSQIWLFGILPERAELTVDPQHNPDEWEALVRFMDAGGGVFATGDHQNLGKALAGALPRVRSMRRWHWPKTGPNGEPKAPDQKGDGRHNTIADPAPGTPGNQGREDDTLPQTIRPRIYARRADYGLLHRVLTYPHPVLCGPEGPVTWLPDHMHEGTCEVPADLARSYVLDGAPKPEYPQAADGQQPAPDVIAWASSTDTTTTEFGVLCAYDGHRGGSGDGRVIVDARVAGTTRTWSAWCTPARRRIRPQSSGRPEVGHHAGLLPEPPAVAGGSADAGAGPRQSSLLNLLAYFPILHLDHGRRSPTR